MKPSIFLLCLVAELCQVTGQLLTKHAMNATNLTPVPWGKVTYRLTLGIAIMAGWFFIWASLLQKMELSYIYPFEGLCPVLIVIGALLFLKEKPTLRSWIGIVLISAGIAIVAAS